MFKKDYDAGVKHQTELKPMLEAFFKEELKETGPYAKYDYTSKETDYELKSRNNTYAFYPTTCIACDKIDPEHKKRQVYLFHFTDGTYYIKYDKTLFDTFLVKEFRRFRQGVRDKEKPYIYIPIDQLIRIN